MLILTVLLVGGGLWLITGWVVDELTETRRDRPPKRTPKHTGSHRAARPPRLAALSAAVLASVHELAHAHAVLKGHHHAA